MATTSELVSLARKLGEDVEGQPENVPDALPRLAGILMDETDAQVVAETVIALGRAWDPVAVQLILKHVRVDHPNTDVRLAVAGALPNGVESDSLCRDDVIAALVALSGDENSGVRDWACFGLGKVCAASGAAKDALAARLTDSDDDTRCEALLALAKTGDPRAGTVLRERFTCAPYDAFMLELRAAAELADPILHPLLLRLSQDWADDEDEFMPVLAFALSRCRPGAKVKALKVERELVSQINTLLTSQDLVAMTVGDYPRTELTFHRIEDSSQVIVFDAIWSDEDPWNYPIEQMARSFVFSWDSRNS